MSVDFSAIIENFLTAELGEEVRDSLVAIAEALQSAINSQLQTVTGDLTDPSVNAAARAITVGNILYGGIDHTAKTPRITQFWTPTGTYSINDMPPNSRTFSAASACKNAALPEETAEHNVVIDKIAVNSGGNVSKIVLTDRTTYRQWTTFHSKDSTADPPTYSLGRWLQIADGTDLTKCFYRYGTLAPTGSETSVDLDDVVDFGLFVLSTDYTYTHAPSEYSGTGYLLSISHTPNIKLQVLFDAYFVKTETVQGIPKKGPYVRYSHARNGVVEWSAWACQPDPTTILCSHGVLPANSDLNQIFESGVWTLNSGVSYTNLPAIFIKRGYLFSYSVSNDVGFQLFFDSNFDGTTGDVLNASPYVRYRRHAAGDTSYRWSNWTRLFNSEATSTSLIKGNTGNASIVCAKEHRYSDGSDPVTECYLLEEAGTNRFYLSEDLRTKTYAFTFDGDTKNYRFGFRANGDIIAVRIASTLPTAVGVDVTDYHTFSDSTRMDPYVFLASEGYSSQHLVEVSATGGRCKNDADYGVSYTPTGIKPCGWLGNGGYCVLPNGDTVFCEYTRYTTKSSNVWRIAGNADILNPASWTVVLSFMVTAVSNESEHGFKHCHAVQHDPYAGIVYMSTGDNPVPVNNFPDSESPYWPNGDSCAASCWASSDNGANWSKIGTTAEKYWRFLNMIFTPDWVYWATDTTNANLHYLFKCQRGQDGVIDCHADNSGIVELKKIDVVPYAKVATYGIAYSPENEALVLLDRADLIDDAENFLSAGMPLRAYDLASGDIVEVCRLYPVDNDIYRRPGFRTLHSDFMPDGGIINLGFGYNTTGFNTRNDMRLFDNTAGATTLVKSINNLYIRIYRDAAGTLKSTIGTYYL